MNLKMLSSVLWLEVEQRVIFVDYNNEEFHANKGDGISYSDEMTEEEFLDFCERNPTYNVLSIVYVEENHTYEISVG